MTINISTRSKQQHNYIPDQNYDIAQQSSFRIPLSCHGLFRHFKQV